MRKISIGPHRPVALVVSNVVACRILITEALSSSYWRVVEALDGEESVAMSAALNPDLVLIDIGFSSGAGARIARDIRAQPGALGSVPILAYSPRDLSDAEIRALGMDGRVSNPCQPETLIAAAARWRPDGEMDGAHRLCDVFGVEAMIPLLRSFREQLAEAVVSLDARDVTSAHRITGIAGTLGFAAVSASWARLSVSDMSAGCLARRDARMAIARIDRDPLFDAHWGGTF